MQAGEPEPGSNRQAAALAFVKELTIFLLGICLGFFWQLYISAEPSSQTNIIIGLVVIIICMGRYIMLVRQK